MQAGPGDGALRDSAPAAPVLRQARDGLVAEVVAQLAVRVPTFQNSLDPQDPEGVPRLVGLAVDLLVERVAAGVVVEPDGEQVAAAARELGRLQARDGRPLSDLLGGLRTAGQVAWRELARRGADAAVPPPVLYALAEVVFAFVDEIVDGAADGFGRQQASLAAQDARRREALAARLLQTEPDVAGLQRLSREAGWPLPETVQVVVAGAEAHEALRRALPRAVLTGNEEVTVAVTPAPLERAAPGAHLPGAAGSRRAPPDSLRDLPCVLGEPVGWQQVGPAHERVLGVWRLLRERPPAASTDFEWAGPEWAVEHLPALVLRRSAAALDELAEVVLAPLRRHTDATRERLAETLLVWLSFHGRRAPVAAAMVVHPQTVRYRVGQLRDLFGERLDDPRHRYALLLALHHTLAGSALLDRMAAVADGQDRGPP